jgi:Cys-tRNA(Pro) deacylase
VTTPTTDYLTERGVRFTVKRHTKEALTCEAAAAERGARLSQIVKCMVAESDRELVVMLLPGDRMLKSSKARRHLGAARLELVPAARLRDELGLTVGAISPMALLGRARVLMDPSVLEEELVDISSGDPMAGVELEARQLAELLDAEVVDIVSTRLAGAR